MFQDFGNSIPKQAEILVDGHPALGKHGARLHEGERQVAQGLGQAIRVGFGQALGHPLEQELHALRPLEHVQLHRVD